MSNQLDTFRMRLEELKKQGVDIDPQKVTDEIVNPQDIPKDLNEEEKREKLFDLTKSKIISLVDDFKSHYRQKGRKLKVIVRIEKENSADAYGEKFVYDDDMEVISMIEIGTKGKYQKVIEEA